jgi:S1-C subfamily serine protease
LPAVVLLLCSNDKGEKSLASGFFVRTNNESGVVATNYHVIKGMDQGVVSAVLGGEKRIMAVSAVLNFDDINDLAVLRVQPVESPQTIRINNLSLATSTPSVGETIYALGNPEGLTGTFSQGIVSGIRSFDLGKRIQITAPISPGSSGGPVINSKRDVVGIVQGALSEGQNLNFAVPVSFLVKLLAAVDAGAVYGHSRESIDCLLGLNKSDLHWCWVKSRPTQD